MRKRVLVVVFFAGLLFTLGSACMENSPGYMDAYYYYSGGVSLAEGRGLSEQFLWNYLDDPSGLPHPGFGYWMPLTSFLAAAGIRLLSGFMGMFRSAQLGFVLVAACIPPLTAALAWKITGKEWNAWFSGFLAVFMGYYQPFAAAVDSFGIYMLFGGLFFLAAREEGRLKYLLVGLLAGAMHLARADGVLWLGMAGLAVLVDRLREKPSRLFKAILSKPVMVNGLIALGGYMLVMTPWMVRNYLEFGTLLSAGGSKTLWVLDYDELFSYPADMLSFDRWWAACVTELLKARYNALIINLQSTAASLGMLFPGLLAVFGIFQHRKDRSVQLGILYWLLLIFVMSAVFPFAGVHGGFFHSGAALLPLLWAMVPSGMEILVAWSVRTFKWKVERIKPFYIGLLFAYAALFTFAIVLNTIVGTDQGKAPIWDETQRQYQAVEDFLQQLPIDADAVIVSATPPAYFSITGRRAIAIPDGGLGPLFAVIERYDAELVLVEENHPDELEGLYLQPEDVGQLKYVATISGVHIFRWEGE